MDLFAIAFFLCMALMRPEIGPSNWVIGNQVPPQRAGWTIQTIPGIPTPPSAGTFVSKKIDGNVKNGWTKACCRELYN
jgi:hypothetical protein